MNWCVKAQNDFYYIHIYFVLDGHIHDDVPDTLPVHLGHCCLQQLRRGKGADESINSKKFKLESDPS